MELDFLQDIDSDFELGAEDSLLSEVYLADGEVDQSDNGLFWKDILREGEWAYRPGPGQKPVPIPLKVISGKANTNQEIGMADLVEAFNDGAVEHVTVPTSHEDRPHENTGYVKELKILERDGKTYLSAGIDFTEPDIKGKVARKSIANTSAGIIFDYVKKDSGKKYRMALGHVALTNKPWINGMTPFGEKFSEDQIASVILAVDEDYTDDLTDTISLSANEIEAAMKILHLKDFTAERRRQLAKKGFAMPDGSFPIENEQDLKNAIQAFGRAKNKVAAKRHIIKRARALGKTNLLPESWRVSLSEQTDNEAHKGGNGMASNEDKTDEKDRQEDKDTSNDPAPDAVLSEEAREALKTELSEEFKAEQAKKDAENEKLRMKVHEMNVEKRIGELKEQGFSDHPGLLKEIRSLMLADNEAETLVLSETDEDGKTTEVKLSLSGAIERLIAAFPKQDGKVNFGEQTNAAEDKDRPDSGVEEKSIPERVEGYAEDLGLSDEVYKSSKSKDGDA